MRNKEKVIIIKPISIVSIVVEVFPETGVSVAVVGVVIAFVGVGVGDVVNVGDISGVGLAVTLTTGVGVTVGLIVGVGVIFFVGVGVWLDGVAVNAGSRLSAAKTVNFRIIVSPFKEIVIWCSPTESPEGGVHFQLPSESVLAVPEKVTGDSTVMEIVWLAGPVPINSGFTVDSFSPSSGLTISSDSLADPFWLPEENFDKLALVGVALAVSVGVAVVCWDLKS